MNYCDDDEIGEVVDDIPQTWQEWAEYGAWVLALFASLYLAATFFPVI